MRSLPQPSTPPVSPLPTSSLSAAKSLANHFISVVTYDQPSPFSSARLSSARCFLHQQPHLSFTNCAARGHVFVFNFRFRASAVSTSLELSLPLFFHFPPIRFLLLVFFLCFFRRRGLPPLPPLPLFLGRRCSSVSRRRCRPRPRSRALFSRRKKEKKESASSFSLFSSQKKVLRMIVRPKSAPLSDQSPSFF